LTILLTVVAAAAALAGLYHLIGAALGSDLFGDGPSVMVEVSPDLVAVDGLAGSVDAHDVAAVNLEVDTSGTGGSYRLWALVQALEALAAAAGLWMLRGIANSLRFGDPFIAANAGRLRIIGLLLLTVPLLVQFATGIVESELALTTALAEFGNPSWLISFLPAFFAAIVLTLAEIWKRGVALRDEQKFTV
jgi:hypothetical protein